MSVHVGGNLCQDFRVERSRSVSKLLRLLYNRLRCHSENLRELFSSQFFVVVFKKLLDAVDIGYLESREEFPNLRDI